MRHPTDGDLRRLLDEPHGLAAAEREHVEGCEACRRSLEVIRDDADAVREALSFDAGELDVDGAWRRLSVVPATPVAVPRRRRRLRDVLGRPAVAGVAVAAVLAGAGTAAAGGWFEAFRTEEITPIAVTSADLNALPDLAAYGEITSVSEPGVHEVGDAAEAAAEAGLDVPEVAALPRGIEGAPNYQVGGEASADFTFSAERAERAGLPTPPAGLDGTTVRLVAGPGVAVTWPSLVVGRAVAPKAFTSSGAGFDAVRDYLLPSLPDDLAAALRSFNADGSTLPLPVPAERFRTSTVLVDGEEATLLTAHDRSMAAVVWVEDGIVTVVAGTLDAGEVLDVARGLR